MKNFIIGMLIIGVAIVVGCTLIPSSVVNYGASSGPDHYNMEYFWSGLVDGGKVTTLTATDTAQTLTALQVCEAAIVKWDPSGTQSTTTFPTAATLAAQCLMMDGMSKSFLFANIADGAENIQLGAGTGNTIFVTYNGSTTAGIIRQNEVAKIKIIRASSTAMYIEVIELR